MSENTQNEVGIGSTIWAFDINRRVYGPDHGSPIYREHWVKGKIVGENARSWITNVWNKKVPKKGDHRGWAFSQQEVDDDVWTYNERHRIVQTINHISPAMLRKIAALIGHEDLKPLESFIPKEKSS